MGVKRRLLKGHQVVQRVAILYLMFFIVSQLTTPTTASFHDTETTVGKLSAAESFDEEQQKESNNTDPENSNSRTKDKVDKDANDPVGDQKDDSDSQQPSEKNKEQEENHVASEAHSDQVNKDENGT